jgi:hypothetical protein
MNLAFGENWDAAGAKALAEGWFHGDFSDIPSVKVVSSAEIGGANGAFAAATDTIYLSKEFLAENAMNPAAVADVLLEEIGHSVDARLNVTDSPGDEGAIFLRVVQGKDLSQGEIQALKSEDDTANVVLGGEDTTIEMNQQRWTVWRYADWRGKNNDFWVKPDGTSDQNGNRSDGKDGIYVNWGKGSPFDSPNTDIVNELNYFATSGATKANFEAGATYKFRVSADDGLIMATQQIGKSDFNFITPLSQDRKQIEWQMFPNRSVKEYSWTPPQSGQYYVYFWHYDITGDAGVDISWQKTVPNGFTSVKSAQGVNLYESADKSAYVQVIDLSQGASIKLLTGQQQENSSKVGAYGGTSPKFQHEKIGTFWNGLSSSNSNAFSISNGAFFTSRNWFGFLDNETNLSYPLKINSQTFDGSQSENLGSKLKLEIWNDRASITQFNDHINSIKDSSASQVLVGAPKQTKDQNNPNDSSGRTYVGVEDRDSNGSNETVLILTSERKTITDAVKILKDFGADDNEIMQLDGGGSSQLMAKGEPYLKGDGRTIPQSIGVLSAA